MQNSEMKNRYKAAPFYKVAHKEPTTLLKYEFLHRYFSKVSLRFPERLLFRIPLNLLQLTKFMRSQ